MGKPQYFQILIRLLFISINGGIIVYTYQKDYLVNSFVLLLILGFQTFLLIDYIKKSFADIEKSIDCLLHDDYSNTISAEKRKNPLHNKTALLLEKHRKKSLIQTSESLILTNIIESLSIEVLILRKDTTEEIEVFQINKAFVDFLKIPKFYNWKLLQNKIGKLDHFITDWKTIKHTVTIDVNGNKESFFLKTSVTQTNQYEYLIISLETIQQLIDKKEKEAWFKLMNVMSHEIINTITPISSLAENLDSLLQEETDEDVLDELSEGLKIIKKRSHHLTSFVDTYRKLAELPLPNKKPIDLNQVVNNTLALFQQKFSQSAISVSFKNDQVFTINADNQQIEQVIINLISNSLFALKNIDEPKIDIDITKENYRTVLTFTDNGIGIPDDIKNNVFIPYFTTRKDGSGIGLTLSKSIIEAHNGKIHFTSQNNKTSFVITFINKSVTK